MNRFVRTIVATAGLIALIAPATGSARDDRDNDRDNDRRLRIELTGFHEVIPVSVSGTNTTGPGAIFSTGSGRLTLKIDKQHREIDYELSYSFPDPTPLAGAQFVNQAHLHFGQKHTVGGINVWLCQSADNPAPAAVAAATPTCPSPAGTVSGTIAPGQVLGLTAQAFPAGQDGFDALLEALRSEAIYGNVHTDRFPSGEIRGQFVDRGDD